jgi:hypothetical protein
MVTYILNTIGDALTQVIFLHFHLPFHGGENNSQDIVVGTCWKELKPLGYGYSTHAFIFLIIFWPEKHDFGTFSKDLTKKKILICQISILLVKIVYCQNSESFKIGCSWTFFEILFFGKT